MPNEKLTLKTKLAYGGFGAGISLPSNIANSAITFFYNTILGLRADLIGIAWLIFMVWNTINDPLFGFLEDRTKSEKYGRRIPYIRFGAPFFGICFILCWFPFLNVNNQLTLFINLLIILFVFDTIFTILGLINFSLPSEMALTAKERANLSLYGNILMSLSTFVSFILPIVLLTGLEPSDPILPFLIAMIFVGVICAIIIFLSSFYLKENKYTQMEDTLPFFKSIKETFKNKQFLIFEVANFSFTIALTILPTAIFYYTDYVLGVSGFTATIPLVTIFLMIFIFLVVYNRIIRKYGVKKTFILALIWAGLSFILTFFIAWSLIFAIVGFILIGIGISGYMLTSQVVVADIIDYDEIRTGKRRETTYSGINALITKPAVSLANWLFLYIIASFGFDSALETQTYSSQLGIMIGFVLIPAIFLIFGAFVMFFYKLDGETWLSQKAEIIKIHEGKEIEYLKYLESKRIDNNKKKL